MSSPLKYAILLLLTILCRTTFAQNKHARLTPLELLYYYDAELEKIEKEIAVLTAEYETSPSSALLSSISQKKLKKEILNIYGSKAVKRSLINLKDFAYFSASQAFLAKQKQLEENYDLKINLSADAETLEEAKSLGTNILKTFTKNESSAKDRRIDVTVHYDAGSLNVLYTINLSQGISAELSGKETFEDHTYSFSGDNTSGELITTKFMRDLEAFLSVLTVRVDATTISDLWPLRNTPDSTITFMTPAGRPFTLLLNKLTKVGFSYNDEDLQTSDKYDFFADGSLQSFTYNHLNYVRCRLEKHREHFDGYYVDGSNCHGVLTDTLTRKLSQSNKVVVVYACVTNGSLVFKASKVATGPGVTWPVTNHDGSGAFQQTLPVQFSTISQDPVLLSGAALTSTYSADSKRFLEALNICDRDYIPSAITVANIITICPKIISQCYGLERLIDDFDLGKHLLSASNNQIPQTRTPLEQYQDKVVMLLQRVKELQGYANSTLNTDNQTKNCTTAVKASEYINNAANLCALNFISNTERLRLLKLLVAAADWDSQKAIVQLFKTLNTEVSETATVSFFDALLSNTLPNGNSLLTELYSKITFNDYTALNKTLCQKYIAKPELISHYFPASNEAEFNTVLYYDDSYLITEAPVGTHRYDVSLNANGSVTITKEVVDYVTENTNVMEGGAVINTFTSHWKSTGPVTMSAFTPVTIINRSSLSSVTEASAENGIIIAPAVFLKFAEDKTFNNDVLRTTAAVVDVVSIASGPGLVLKAYRAGRMALALYEGAQIVGSLGNLVVNGLEPTSALKKWVDDFNAVIVIWGGARVLSNPKLYSADYFALVKNKTFQAFDKVKIEDLIKRYEQLKATLTTKLSNVNLSKQIDGVIDYLRRLVKGKALVSLVDNLSAELRILHDRMVTAGIKAIEDGNTIRYMTTKNIELAKIENGVFIVVPTKPNIPDILNYLSESYILNHVSKFEKEGCGFIVVKKWTEDARYNSMPPRKFVGLRSEMDRVISKYKLNGNDWKILRDELNLGPDVDLSTDEIYYIKIDGNDPRFSFDVPNGNEGGAIQGEWVPCGFTKSGTAEAALVGSEKIIHNKSITELTNYFDGKWEKIK